MSLWAWVPFQEVHSIGQTRWFEALKFARAIYLHILLGRCEQDPHTQLLCHCSVPGAALVVSQDLSQEFTCSRAGSVSKDQPV